ncbi:MAG: hypothetical protein K0B06_13445 [Brevefilum sp.]|nr:hypothetical protein [Brevefilum sp.]
MESNICPYLGLINDPNTGTSFPDGANACHRASPPALVVLDYQSSTCLQAGHKECPGYIHAWRDGFPKSIRRRKSIINPAWFEGLAWLLVAIPVILFIWAGFTGRLSFLALDFRPGTAVTPTSRPFFTRTPTVTLTATVTTTFTETPLPETETPTPTQTLTRTATLEYTETPTATATATRIFWTAVPRTPVPTNTPGAPRPTQPPAPTEPPPPTNTPLPPTPLPTPET